MPTSLELIKRFYPEAVLNGFTSGDGVVAFYSQIRALLDDRSHVLDFGAGRGAQISEDPVPFRRHLQDLRSVAAHVEGCDIDGAVLANPYVHAARQIAPGDPLPYADASFDLIVSRSVFEHLEHPREVAAELGRVLKPGGVVAVMTPNAWGYPSIAARLVPNRLHSRALTSIQPDRKPEDVFPTYYRVNRPAAVRAVFGPGFAVHAFYVWAEPYYHFNRPFLFRLLKLFHGLAPDALAPTLCVFVRKEAKP
jgi:SAM-dependent methyltransferase